ncbi:hypothetical protein SAMN05443287_108156 [Micromonospora phaseoli]|uniref:Uncharacterized protein n=1 Tax=Micromonospora phaseoli TaxID=1144548 RepID=A0A1H7C0H3_9ACTN|nr:hypothetical protein [Micromonospora phaseoli]PZV92705.1 hypothetical protein CLV64_110128 [Micromonospora phaseoli]GIJ76641.1 hypothetical protein Xph01_10730 [Micromonospora phaseoli]SEJ83138.1 hypothetical protein SAMN05443287_108156 [Micromonospora phaseoli]
MTSRAGEAFSIDRAVSDIEALLAVDLSADGAVVSEGDPETGEWTVTRGAGFQIRPIWESEALTGVYGRDWNEAEEAAAENLTLVVGELDRWWGPHRPVSMRVPLFRDQAGEPVPALFQSLCDVDCYGDLTVWGPVTADGRWVAVSVNQCDGDAPMILTAVVSDRPITELAD